MGLIRFITGKVISRKSMLVTIGGFAASRILKRAREKWQNTNGAGAEALLAHMTPYDTARAAGKLLAGWLRFNVPNISVPEAEKHIQKLLMAMDLKDDTPVDQARSRLLASKTLFDLEGFRLAECRYEDYQQEARSLLRKNPDLRKVSRQAVFRAEPFTTEDLIGTTHRMLFTLGNTRLGNYIVDFLETQPLRNDIDYMARLIALTIGIEDEIEFRKTIEQWFHTYRDFKISETHRHESVITQSLDVVSGNLPAKIGFDLLGRALKRKKQ